MQWSPDGAFLATRSDAAAGVVWVWDVARMSLAAVLQHAGSVCELAWNPKPDGGSAQLAVISGSPSVYFWTPGGATCVQIPVQGFQVRMLGAPGARSTIRGVSA
jgi:WD40 repeat protein